MKLPISSRSRGALALLVALFSLFCAASGARAQSLTITRPANFAAGLSGTIRLEVTYSDPVPPAQWGGGQLQVRDSSGFLVESVLNYGGDATHDVFDWISNLLGV